MHWTSAARGQQSVDRVSNRISNDAGTHKVKLPVMQTGGWCKQKHTRGGLDSSTKFIAPLEAAAVQRHRERRSTNGIHSSGRSFARNSTMRWHGWICPAR